MKTFRFKDFQVYKDAKKFRKTVRHFLEKFPDQERYRLEDQVQRSLFSVLLNIAEGSAKKSDKDFARFLGISIGSMNEIIAAFDLAHDDGFITMEDQQLLEQEAEIVTKQLGSFIKTLTYRQPNATS